MSENRFQDCHTVAQALRRYRDMEVVDADDDFELTVRLHQLAPKLPRTVDEAGRERAREVTYDWWLNTTGMSRANADQLVDRIIDALGWTAAEPQMTTDKYGRNACVCGYVPPTHTHADDCPVFGTQARAQAPTPAPATPAVELDVTALERIRVVLNCHENTRTAMDKPMFGDMPDIIIPGALPMRITTNPFGVSVLRIGGTDE